MQYFARVLLLIVALEILALAMSFYPSQPALADKPGTIDPVLVTNTPANPVPTQAVDNPARQAVMLLATVALGDGARSGTGSYGDVNGIYQVPPGNRLVVETITGELSVPTGQRSSVLSITIMANGQIGFLHVVPVYASTENGLDQYWFVTPVTAYDDPGQTIGINFSRTSDYSGSAFVHTTLIGHLVSIQ